MAGPALDSRLAEIVERLEHSGFAAELWDSQWRLAWVSRELKEVIDEHDEERIGYGLHYLEVRFQDTWRRTVTEATRRRAFVDEVPFMVERTPGGKEAMREMLGDELRHLVDDMEPKPQPPAFGFFIEFLQGPLPQVRVVTIATRLHAADGEALGTLMVYGAGLAPRLLGLVARGDPSMFDRMARLMEPGRHRAAILFADLQGSATLSRRLPSGSYFTLICELTTAIDAAVLAHSGIVGKHAGDGVTAFFLADDLGSDSAAAHAALSTARAISESAQRVGEELSAGGPVSTEDCRVNVGVHWGGALYMGQVVTGGRLEVTALGDMVNEAARIQESARGGTLLASKAVLERLEPADAGALGIDTDRFRYCTLAELDSATEKARRDAGGVAVTTITP